MFRILQLNCLVWAFLLWKFFDYGFNLHICYPSIWIFSFFLIQSLFHELAFNFVKNFFHICWENHIFFSLLIWWNTLIGYLMLNSTCIPGINIWSWYLFINSLIQFAEVLLEDLLRTFISIFMEDIDFFILYFNFFLFSLKNV